MSDLNDRQRMQKIIELCTLQQYPQVMPFVDAMEDPIWRALAYIYFFESYTKSPLSAQSIVSIAQAVSMITLSTIIADVNADANGNVVFYSTPQDLVDDDKLTLGRELGGF